MTLNKQVLKDKEGNGLGVFLPMDEYEKIIEQLEELEDIKSYDEAIKSQEETVPLREAIKERKQQDD